MKYIDDILVELSSRLPELEWKISSLNHSFSSHSIPKGLFRPHPEFSAVACVNEIKEDITALSQQKNERSANFLATRIQQKINVLVTICNLGNQKNKREEKVHFGLQTISTRQQWIQGLELDIEILSKQQDAMTKALQAMRYNKNNEALLNLKAELGEVERRLTLAKETLNQALAR
jgi:hypothetical protein